jgi:hypothetical protein
MKKENNNQVNQNKKDLHISINEKKINIDRSCFVKSDEEKEAIKQFKKEVKK